MSKYVLACCNCGTTDLDYKHNERYGGYYYKCKMCGYKNSRIEAMVLELTIEKRMIERCIQFKPTSMTAISVRGVEKQCTMCTSARPRGIKLSRYGVQPMIWYCVMGRSISLRNCFEGGFPLPLNFNNL